MTDIADRDRTASVPAIRRIARARPTGVDIWFNDALFTRAKDMAKIMAEARGFVPSHLEGKQQACFVIVVKSMDWKLDPMAVAMCTYQTPGGKIGYEGKLCHAILENTGKFVGGVKLEHYGDWDKVQGKFEIAQSSKGSNYARATYKPADEVGLGVKVKWTIKGENEPRVFDITLRQCYPRNSTLWATDPKTQIGYLAIRRFANTTVPGIFMGLPFDHEEEGMPGDNARDVTDRGQGEAEPELDQFTGNESRVLDIEPEPHDHLFALQAVDGEIVETSDATEAWNIYLEQVDAARTLGKAGIEGWLESNVEFLAALEGNDAADVADAIRKDVTKLLSAFVITQAPAAAEQDGPDSKIEANAPAARAETPSTPPPRADEDFWQGKILSINPAGGKGDRPRWKDFHGIILAAIAAARSIDEVNRLMADNAVHLDKLHLANAEWRQEIMHAFTRRRADLRAA